MKKVGSRAAALWYPCGRPASASRPGQRRLTDGTVPVSLLWEI